MQKRVGYYTTINMNKLSKNNIFFRTKKKWFNYLLGGENMLEEIVLLLIVLNLQAFEFFIRLLCLKIMFSFKI